MTEPTLDELRERAALLREIAALEAGEQVDAEPEIPDDEMLLLRELLGEFVKQQIVQDTELPTLDQEHYGLAAVLQEHHVDWLIERGWADPVPREWKRDANRVTLPILPPAPTQAEIVRARIAARNPQLAQGGIIQNDVLHPEPDVSRETVIALDKPKKPKKPKKVKPLVEVQRYADGTPVEVVPAEVPVDPLQALNGADRTYLQSQLELAEAAQPLQSPDPPVGWLQGADGRLIPPPRKPVKAVYPPVRGRGTPPPGLMQEGMTTASSWPRDSSGRRVPPDQVNDA